ALRRQRLWVILDAVVEDGGLFRRWRHAPVFLISCIGVLHEGVGGDGFFSPPLLLAQRYSLFNRLQRLFRIGKVIVIQDGQRQERVGPVGFHLSRFDEAVAGFVELHSGFGWLFLLLEIDPQEA